VFFEENVPRPIIRKITDETQSLSSISREGWEGIQNGELIKRLVAGNWDVFVTADKYIRYQQQIGNRGVAIGELPTNRLSLLEPISSEIALAIRKVGQNGYVTISL